MSQPNRKYKRLEALLSEAKPTPPDVSPKPVTGKEVETLKAKVAALEAALEKNKTTTQPGTPTSSVKSQSLTARFAAIKMPPQPPVADQSENSALSDVQRRRNMGLAIGFLTGVAGLAVTFYFVLYLQTGVWQILAESGFILTAIAVVLAVSYPLVRRNKFQEASTWLLIGISIAYASPEIVWKNATTNLLVTGILLLFVVGTTYPPQPMAWLIVPSFYIVYMFAANLFEPLPRFDINQSPVLRIFIPGVTAVIGVWVIWQLFTLILRFSKDEQASARNQKQASSEGKRSFRFRQSPFWRALSRLLVEPDETVLGVESRRQAQLLTTSLAILIPLYILGQFFRNSGRNSIDSLIGSSIALALIGAYGLSRTQRFQAGAFLTVAALTASIFSSFLKDTAQFTSSEVLNIIIWITLPLVISSIILPARSMIFYLAGNVTALIALAFMPTIPYGPMFPSITMVVIVSILLYVGRRFREQIEQENQARLITINKELEDSERLSQFINKNLFLATEVSKRLSQVRDLSSMLTESTELIRTNFNLYYVQVYLTNPNQNALLLQAGTGSMGAELLLRGHRLSVEGTSINGRAANEKRAVIVSDTTNSAFFRPNPLLPDTRSEMAVPLMIGDKVVGVLDLQSSEPGTLNQEVLPVFEALAGQMAIAIQNAALFSQSEEARKQVEATVRGSTESGWKDFMNAIERGEKIGFTFNQTDVIPMESMDGMNSTNSLNVPITVTGANVGAIRLVEEARKWTAQETEIVQAAAEQLAQHIDNLRLLAQAESYRSEAEQATRRLTREGWETFLQTRRDLTGFTYDLNNVHTLDSGNNNGYFESAITKQFAVRNETLGELAVNIGDKSPEEINELISAVAEQLGSHIENLRLSEQNEKRAFELATVATVSTTASTVLDPDKLLQSVVDLTKERFNVYHTHIYLADESWETLLLAAGAGEVGRQMVEKGHAIQINAERSLVARASRERRSIIVNDVRAEAGFLPNPLLPETRAEMAVPMIVGDKVIGVFDVQADTLDHFTDEDANIYTTLASQVAVALQNARLYVEQAATVTQLRELDRLKSSFLANMSHELRTPLNSILGFADVMLEELDGPLTENMSNDLGLIYKNGQHLLHLINDVLDMAKIESGKMNLNIEKFNLQETIEEVVSITSPLASEKNLALFIEPDSDHALEINADKIRLRQVMINIINNSIKFTDKGKVAIRMVREDDNVLIRVKDTGVGIPADLLESVFQEFTQVDTSTTRKEGGTGLGLPISRRLIEMHSGRLWAESSGIDGEGSTFYISLPIEAKIKEEELKAN